MNLQSFIEGLEGTRMLYQEDSYLRKFEAKVVRFYREKKRNFYIVLDKTAFHPKSGGQPSDTGFISGSNFKIKYPILVIISFIFTCRLKISLTLTINPVTPITINYMTRIIT